MKKRILFLFGLLILIASLYTLKCFLQINYFDCFSLGIYKTCRLTKAKSNGLAFARQAQEDSFQEPAKISVYYDQQIQEVNHDLFGHNFLGHKTDWFPNNIFSDYGAGLWNKTFTKQPLELAQAIGINFARFPGGCGTHEYDWKKTIGKNRKEYAFGLDEFLQFCQKTQAEPILTVSYFTGNENDAADLVEYLNSQEGSWAKKRAQNGEQEPYDVKYFEIGNEVWHGDHKDIRQVGAKEYSKHYLKYYKAMKAIDPNIKIGVILHDLNWNKTVLKIIKDKVDFGILHQYPSPAWGKALNLIDSDAIFKTSLAMVDMVYEDQINQTLDLLKKHTYKDIPLAITEYNGGFVQDEPVPYRHTLGNALVNAKLLELYLKYGNKIITACHWNFINEYWGMIANGFKDKISDLKNPYYKRPNYYVFQLFNDHLGKTMVKTKVKSPEYDLSDYPFFLKQMFNANNKGKVVSKDLLPAKWIVEKVKGITVKQNDGIVNISFNDPDEFNYFHCFKSVKVKPNSFYRLSGYIKTEKLLDMPDNGICLEVQDSRGWQKTHSGVSTNKIKSTNDWTYVEALYKTLSDAKKAKIIARRIGDVGPLKGKAFLKQVKFEEFVPEFDLKIPYLSIIASQDDKRLYLIVINKSALYHLPAKIDIGPIKLKKKAKSWYLSSNAYDATNEIDHDMVQIRQENVEIIDGKFDYRFKPHSITAIEIYVN
jgi:alpha-N-arabinofuranosidase